MAVDDALMGITHVVRAEEHLTNSLRQCLILDALEFPRPQYAHCSLILGEDRSKLSKRHGATSVGQFRQQVGLCLFCSFWWLMLALFIADAVAMPFLFSRSQFSFPAQLAKFTPSDLLDKLWSPFYPCTSCLVFIAL